MTATIYLIRHAEKPHGDTAPSGVDADGKQDPDSLTPRGWQRAGALVAFFGASAGVRPALPALATPTHLFASRVSYGGASYRPRETLVPLADRLGIAIDTRFVKEQTAELAQAALDLDGVVLIAWEHHMIPVLASAILGVETGIPGAWPDDCFDVTWVFEPGTDGRLRFRQVPQRLLAGDRTDPIAV